MNSNVVYKEGWSPTIWLNKSYVIEWLSLLCCKLFLLTFLFKPSVRLIWFSKYLWQNSPSLVRSFCFDKKFTCMCEIVSPVVPIAIFSFWFYKFWQSFSQLSWFNNVLYTFHWFYQCKQMNFDERVFRVFQMSVM